MQSVQDKILDRAPVSRDEGQGLLQISVASYKARAASVLGFVVVTVTGSPGYVGDRVPRRMQVRRFLTQGNHLAVSLGF